MDQPPAGRYDQPFANLRRDYDFDYKLLLATGGFGSVFKIQKEATKEWYALKIVNKRNTRDMMNALNRERAAWALIDCKYIIKMVAVFSTSVTNYYLLEYAPNKDIYSNMYEVERGAGALHIKSVRFFSAQLLKALEYLRGLGFVHRDLKLENVVLDKDFNVKLTDFGAVKQIGDRQGNSMVLRWKEQYSRSGTLANFAPEILFEGDVTFSTDYWGLGLLIYEMYCARSLGDLQRAMPGVTEERWLEYSSDYFMDISKGNYEYPYTTPDPDLKDLVRKITHHVAELRLGHADINEVMSHPFFKDVPWWDMDTMKSPGIVRNSDTKVKVEAVKAAVSAKVDSAKAKAGDVKAFFKSQLSKLRSPPPEEKTDEIDEAAEEIELFGARIDPYPDSHSQEAHARRQSFAAGGPVFKEPKPRQSREPGLDVLRNNFDFDDKVLLCQGGVGSVYKISESKTKKKYALKIYKKADMDERIRTWARRERIVLKLIDSPFIIKLHRSFECPENVYFLLDYAENGDLFKIMYEGQQEIGLDIKCVRYFAAEIVMALAYLRKIGYVHRDIKDDNLVFTTNWHLKLTDFGGSKKMGNDQGTMLKMSTMDRLNSQVGSTKFMAPEVYFCLPVTYGSDLWALGFVVYEMYNAEYLSELKVFDIGYVQRYFRRIDEEGYQYQIKSPNPELKDLVHKLTREEPKDRLGVDDLSEVQSHPFFQGIDWNNLTNTPSPGIIVNKEPRHRQPPGIATIPKAASVSHDLDAIRAMLPSHLNLTQGALSALAQLRFPQGMPGSSQGQPPMAGSAPPMATSATPVRASAPTKASGASPMSPAEQTGAAMAGPVRAQAPKTPVAQKSAPSAMQRPSAGPMTNTRRRVPLPQGFNILDDIFEDDEEDDDAFDRVMSPPPE